LEDDGADKWFRNPDQEFEVQPPVQAYVGPREILEWAKTDGPLSDKHA
jgi:hypothetical protein